MYYTEHKPKNKKWGRPRNEALRGLFNISTPSSSLLQWNAEKNNKDIATSDPMNEHVCTWVDLENDQVSQKWQN